MKTFKDLIFEDQTILQYSKKGASMHFENGYGISVITGYGTYTNDTKPYEVAVLFENQITYNTHITDNVVGWLNEKEVTEIMKKIQEL